jgi:hypothetical protein
MKSVLLATSLMAVLASAKPLEKRYYVTETDTYTVTVTETGSGAEATGGWGNWGNWPTSADPAAATTAAATSDAWSAYSYSTPAAAVSTPAATTTTTSAWPSASSGGSVSSYAQAILDQHNNHRSNHSASPLVWDDGLASTAQTIGQSCVYAHDT